MKTNRRETIFVVASHWQRRAAAGVLLLTMLITVWFFWRVWQNVTALSTRTLPGILAAAEALDRAADLEISREEGMIDLRRAEELLACLRQYETTIAIDQDRINFDRVKTAYAIYMEEHNGDNWQRLRAELKAMLQFRHQRAQSFASDSRGYFTSALAINVSGLVCFSLLALFISVFLAWTQPFEARPDDF